MILIYNKGNWGTEESNICSCHMPNKWQCKDISHDFPPPWFTSLTTMQYAWLSYNFINSYTFQVTSFQPTILTDTGVSVLEILVLSFTNILGLLNSLCLYYLSFALPDLQNYQLKQKTTLALEQKMLCSRRKGNGIRKTLVVFHRT